MNEQISRAEAAVKALEEKRLAHGRVGTELSEQRAKLMLDVVTKGGKSNEKVVRHGGELAAIDEALVQARRMLADLRQQAQAAEVAEADREKAERVAKIAKTMAIRLERVDDHFAHPRPALSE